MRASLERGIDHLLSQQREDGCWEGEMVWCTMILSQYIIVRHVTGRPVDEHSRRQMIKYYRASRTPEGVWGLHPESGGYVFFTTLAYVALRLIGLTADDPMLSTARQWLKAQKGGVLAIPSWGKFWLATLGLYEYEGVNPMLPEMFLLPKALPFHPRKFYCHTRLIYLGMAYLYGSRSRAELGPVVPELRDELYDRSYEQIDFRAHRHEIAATDLYVPPTAWLRASYDVLRMCERVLPKSWRRRALDRCLEGIVLEQRATQHQALSPVNGLLNCLALWARDPQHPELGPSLDGMEAWKWEDDEEGIRYVGARSHTWDTAFSMLALLEDPSMAERFVGPLRHACAFLRDHQMTAEIAEYREQSRDPALGGWCFSDGSHRWPVSDCTAEALSAVLKMHQSPQFAPPVSARITDDRIAQATRFILSRQNSDGGFGTYESRRGPIWLESVNPSEMFGQCMTERSYIECTASSLTALVHVREAYPRLLRERVGEALERAELFLRDHQRPDGSFAGFWGVNFTYAAFNVAKALRAAGARADDRALRRLADWLISKQRPDGGWGEHYSGCLTDQYVEHSQSQVVQTSWALLALMDIIGANSDSVRRGVKWLESMQREDGSWPSQAVNGVFFGSAMLDYRLYKTYFPVWALARYAARH
jgi:lanosterol synthase